jgi:hypothetical protein
MSMQRQSFGNQILQKKFKYIASLLKEVIECSSETGIVSNGLKSFGLSTFNPKALDGTKWLNAVSSTIKPT